MAAYTGAYESLRSDDLNNNQRRFEQVIGNSPVVESAYREITELRGKLAQERVSLEEEIRTATDFEGILGGKCCK